MDLETVIKALNLLSKLERVNQRVNDLLETTNEILAKKPQRKEIKMVEVVLLSLKEILED